MAWFSIKKIRIIDAHPETAVYIESDDKKSSRDTHLQALKMRLSIRTRSMDPIRQDPEAHYPEVARTGMQTVDIVNISLWSIQLPFLRAAETH